MLLCRVGRRAEAWQGYDGRVDEDPCAATSSRSRNDPRSQSGPPGLDSKAHPLDSSSSGGSRHCHAPVAEARLAGAHAARLRARHPRVSPPATGARGSSRCGRAQRARRRGSPGVDVLADDVFRIRYAEGDAVPEHQTPMWIGSPEPAAHCQITCDEARRGEGRFHPTRSAAASLRNGAPVSSWCASATSATSTTSRSSKASAAEASAV